MAATQTQHSTGWNSKAEGTQDAERNPWSVEYAPLVVKRPAPCQPTEAGSTGRVNFKVFRSKNAVQDAPTRSQIASALDQQALEKVLQDGAELLRYVPIYSCHLSFVRTLQHPRCMQPAPARDSSQAARGRELQECWRHPGVEIPERSCKQTGHCTQAEEETGSRCRGDHGKACI